ncbi:rhodanese-like domain-containing protein [Candidatus Woesearchaeota archaeon]|nr:rhodanese-like domain-containing protein [Candidatus Woesearchaeota archaeon]
MNKKAFILLLGLILIACSSPEKQLTPQEKLDSMPQHPDGYYEVDPDVVNYILRNEPNIIVLDVKTKSSYSVGHLPNAINMPYDELESRLDELDPTRPYLVYGDDMLESMRAAKLMANFTDKDVFRILFNYQQWAKEGYEVKIEKCYLTVGSTPAGYDHKHVWCEGDVEVKEFCADSGKCHMHRIMRTSEIADNALPGPHSHKLFPEED